MGKGLQLLRDGGNNFRVAMAGIEHGNSRSKINHLIAFHIPQRGILRLLNKVIAHYAYAARRRLLATLIQF